MDDIVKAALQKWPHVPHCYGWLALDARGDWYMRDDRIQHAGPFPQVKGSRIDHDKLRAFIERNRGDDLLRALYDLRRVVELADVSTAPFVVESKKLIAALEAKISLILTTAAKEQEKGEKKK